MFDQTWQPGTMFVKPDTRENSRTSNVVNTTFLFDVGPPSWRKKQMCRQNTNAWQKSLKTRLLEW